MNNERMSNSLISSADFTNLNFLQAGNCLEADDSSNLTELNVTTKIATIAPAGNEIQYTLSDMIRDRKALESLTMSGDGTLIKDSQIGQIDDISLATLSKTASGCSTMDNSTDSVSTCPTEPQPMPELRGLRSTMLLSEEMIGDTIISLVDSLTSPTAATAGTGTPTTLHNATFKRPQVPIHNETLLLAGRQANTTYTEGCNTPEEAARCETPENIERTLSTLQMESTPLTTASARFQHHSTNNNNNNTNITNNNKPWSYTPTLKGRGEINISPIVNGGVSTGVITTPLRTRASRLNQTYEQSPAMLKDVQVQEAPTVAAAHGAASNTFIADTLELLDQIEQPQMDQTYNMSEEQKQMQCILDLAEVEVELLAQQEGDEEQFEHMLAELGKVNSLNAEQLKMQKSLESIKRRFHKEDEQQVEEQQHQPHQQVIEHVQQVTPTSGHQTMLLCSHSQSTSSGSGSGERLLSRRSRLYDDVNLSALHDSNTSGLSNTSCNSKSFIVHRREEEQSAPQGEACQTLQEEQVEQQTEPATSYKLAERRERDRERFKTIKITKEMRARDEKLDNIIVPCIDDEIEQHGEQQETHTIEQQPLRQQSPPGRLSRRDQTESSVGQSNNYLTYKKPKEKSLLMRNQQQQQQQSQETDQTVAETNHGQSQIARSLSRPRYISGLQKFTTVSKATSAGAGLNATTTTSTAATATVAPNVELKSPMGIKSKSFHNLSSNISGIAGPSSSLAPRPSLGGGGLRRPSVQTPSRLPSGLSGMQQQEVCNTYVCMF